MNGRKPITPREQQVLQLLSDGYTQKETARALGLSEGTVAQHLADLRRKWKARTTVQLVATIVAVETGITKVAV